MFTSRVDFARVHIRMPTSKDWYGRSTVSATTIAGAHSSHTCGSLPGWCGQQEHQAYRRGPHIREVESDDENDLGHHSTEAVVEEPDDTGNAFTLAAQNLSWPVPMAAVAWQENDHCRPKSPVLTYSSEAFVEPLVGKPAVFGVALF